MARNLLHFLASGLRRPLSPASGLRESFANKKSKIKKNQGKKID